MRMIDEYGIARFLGSWKGRVAEIENDTNKQFRIRCYIPDVLDSQISNWAFPKLPPNISGTPEIGDQVWVEFEQGDVDKPIWSGWIPSAKDGAQSAAQTMIAEDDDTVAKLIGKGGGKVVTKDNFSEDGISEILEPLTTTQSKYPYVRGIRIGKNIIEVDGTPNQERIQLYHDSGAYFEIGASGQIKKKSKGSEQDWAFGSRTNVTSGNYIEVVEGGKKTHIKKESFNYYDRGLNENIAGNDHNYINTGNKTVNISGSSSTTIGGLYSLQASQINDSSLGNRNEGTLGNKGSFITGANETIIQNSGYALGQTIGDRYTLNFGDKQTTVNVGKIKNIARLGYDLKTTTGYIRVDPIGRVAIGGPTAELLDLFDQTLSLLDTLITNLQAETHLGNLGAPTGPPLNAIAYAQVQAQMAVIKTLLATIKE